MAHKNFAKKTSKLRREQVPFKNRYSMNKFGGVSREKSVYQIWWLVKELILIFKYIHELIKNISSIKRKKGLILKYIK